jgi:serine/threonine protein kinase
MVVAAWTKIGYNSEVAVKVIKKRSVTPDHLRFLRNEAEILRTLSHKNIVNFHQVSIPPLNTYKFKNSGLVQHFFPLTLKITLKGCRNLKPDIHRNGSNERRKP